MVLRWQRLLIEHLVAEHPKNHTTVLALAIVLVSNADPDGTHVYPGQRTMSKEAGIHHTTVEAAIGYLEAAGWLKEVRHRARGLREFQLTIPIQTSDYPISKSLQSSDHPRSEALQSSDHPRSETSEFGSEFGSDFGSEFGPSAHTSLPPDLPTSKGSSSSVDEIPKTPEEAKTRFPELWGEAIREAQTMVGVINLPAYAFEIFKDLWKKRLTEAEIEGQRREHQTRLASMGLDDYPEPDVLDASDIESKGEPDAPDRDLDPTARKARRLALLNDELKQRAGLIEAQETS